MPEFWRQSSLRAPIVLQVFAILVLCLALLASFWITKFKTDARIAAYHAETLQSLKELSEWQQSHILGEPHISREAH